MANNDFLNMDLSGLDELAAEFARAGGLFENVAMTQYRSFGAELERAMKALVFYDEGDLEMNTTVDKPVMRNGEILLKGGSNGPQVLRLHEAPYSSGSRDKYDDGTKTENYYRNGRGLGTRQKPSYRGFQPGRKWVSNAVLALEEEYNMTNTRILEILFER